MSKRKGLTVTPEPAMFTGAPAGDALELERARGVLGLAAHQLRRGYAFDILQSGLDGSSLATDADALFRSLVLDCGVGVEDAARVYRAFMYVAEASFAEQPRVGGDDD